MAENRADVIAFVAKRLLKERIEAAVWSDLISAVQNQFDAQARAQLLAYLKNRDFQDAGQMLGKALLDEMTAAATAEANSLMADDNLTLADLLRIL